MLFLSLTSSSKKTLKLYILFLTHLLKKLNINYSLFNLPKKTKKITLLKSPHVYKKSKEQFEICYFNTTFIFKSEVDIKILKYLVLNKPKSLNLKVKLLER